MTEAMSWREAMEKQHPGHVRHVIVKRAGLSDDNNVVSMTTTSRVLNLLNVSRAANVDLPCEEEAFAKIIKRRDLDPCEMLEKSLESIMDDSDADPAAKLRMLKQSGEEFVDYIRENAPSLAPHAIAMFGEVAREVFKATGITVSAEAEEAAELARINREKAKRVAAAQAQEHRGSGLSTAAQIEMLKGNTMTATMEIFAKAKRGETIYKSDVMRALDEKADEFRKSHPESKLTHQQAFAKVYAAPENAEWRNLYNRAAADVIELRKRAPAPSGGPAYLKMVELGNEIRKSNKNLSPAQAFTRAFKDRDNADLAKRVLEESRSDGPEAA